MSERKPISAFLTNNTIRTYYELDEAMMKAHQDAHQDPEGTEGTEDKHKLAESTARILLANSDLPLLLRARACMVLGSSIDDDYLDMAEQGVRIAQLAFNTAQNPGDLENNLLRDCRVVLKDAQQAHEAHVKRMKEEGEGEDEDEIVSEAPSSVETQPAKKIRQKPQGRVDSGQGGPPLPARWEELDEVTGKWTERGPPVKGENVEVVRK